MVLFPEVDEEKTRINAIDFLSSYRGQKGFINAPVNPKITASWGDGGASSTVARNEYPQEQLEKEEAASKFCAWVDWAINGARKYKYRELLKITYCEGFERTSVVYMDRLTERLGYDVASTSYFRWRDAALLDVAERLGCQVFKK